MLVTIEELLALHAGASNHYGVSWISISGNARRARVKLPFVSLDLDIRLSQERQCLYIAASNFGRGGEENIL